MPFPMTVNVTALNNKGFNVIGGQVVSNAGDVNGDGSEDILVSNPEQGASYVIFGKADSAWINLQSEGSFNGFFINGSSAARAGYALGALGDINGDNKSDVIIGAPLANNAAGQVFVIFGKNDTYPIQLNNLTTQGYVINGINSGDHLGFSVAGAGDINGDTLLDIIIGAPGANNSTGQSYALFSTDNFANINLNETFSGFIINGMNPNDQLGYSVSTAGDMNQDNMTDIILGAPFAYEDSGQGVVIFGKNTTQPVNLGQLGELGFLINGTANSQLGFAVSGGKDINGDGILDVLLGAPGINNATGLAFLVYGKNSTSPINLAQINNNGFTIEGFSSNSQVGYSVNLIDDLNDDSYADMLIGAPGGSNQNGQSFIVYGKNSPSTVNLDQLDIGGVQIYGNEIEQLGFSTACANNFTGNGQPAILVGSNNSAYVLFDNPCPNVDLSAFEGYGYTISGSTPTQFNFEVSGAGDVNGDGIPDVIIGVPAVSNIYVVFGKNDTQPVDLDNLGTQGFMLMGISGSQAGISISPGGDINQDGKDDVIIGAYAANNNAGQVYVVYGKSDNAMVNLASLDIDGFGFQINGINPGDEAGESVSGGWDINGDAIPDIIIGAGHANNHLGQGYVVFGKNDTHLVYLNNLGLQGFTLDGFGGYTGSTVGGVGDMTGDGKDEIIIGAPASSQVYIVFGKENNTTVQLSTLSQSDLGFQINGIKGSDFGRSLSGLGDVNGDTLPDVVIGAPYANSTMGEVYVIYGKNNSATVTVSSLTTDGFTIYSANGIGYLGEDVSSIGDVNGDGLSDMLIASLNSTNGIGQSNIIYGKRNNNPIAVSTLGAQGIVIKGLPGVSFPNPALGIDMISGIGDINNDGKPDFVITPPTVNQTQQAFVTFSCANPVLAPVTSSTPKPIPSGSSSDEHLTRLQLAMLTGFSIGGFLLVCLLLGGYLYKRYRRRNLYDFDDEDENIETQALLDITEMNRAEVKVERRKTQEDKNTAEALYQQALRSCQNQSNQPADYQSVRQLLEQAVAQNHVESIYELGQLCEKEARQNPSLLPGKLEQAVSYYQQAMEKGFHEASYELIRANYRLGQYYQLFDIERAITYYELAIQAGYLSAYQGLQQIMEKGYVLHSPVLLAQMNSYNYGQQARHADNQKEIEKAMQHLESALAQDTYERSLVHFAVLYDCRRVLKKLIYDKAIINKRDILGKTPLDIARQNQNQPISSLLQEQECWLKQLNKSEERFQQLLMQLHESKDEKINSEDELLSIEAKTLQQKILAITEKDIFAAGKNQLKLQLQKIDGYTQAHLVKLFKQLSKQLKSPNLLFSHMLKKGESQQKALKEAFRQLQQLVESIEETQAALSSQQHELHMTLEYIKGYYQTFLGKMRSAKDETEQKALFTSKAILHSAGLNFRQLTADAYQQLVVKAEMKYRDNQHGIHVVREYQGVHYKLQPHAPGVEYMVNSLAEIIVGQGTSTTALLNISYGTTKRVYLASKTVIGVNLEHILMGHYELIEKIQRQNFSAMFMLSLLSDPQDGKADNYMVKVILDEQGAINHLKIVGIDNDIAFAEPVIKQHHGENKGKHFINVKNVLYFFPQMDEVINTEFRNYFLTCSPEVVVIQWLEALGNRNKEYMQLLEEKVLSPEQLEELQLPIRLVPRMAVKLCDRIKKIQLALLQNLNLTHRQLLDKIEPVVQRYYQAIQKKEPHPWYATRKLYKAALAPSIEDSLRLTTKINSRHTLLTSLAYLNASSDEFERNRIQTIQAAMEEFITAIDLLRIDNPEQKSAAAYIGKLNLIEKLTLTNESLLSRVSLPELVQKFPRIKTLTLLHCHNVSTNDLLLTLLQNPQIKLKIGNCAKIATAHDWQRIGSSCKDFSLILFGHQNEQIELAITREEMDSLLKRSREANIVTDEIEKFLLIIGKEKESIASLGFVDLQNSTSSASHFIQRQHEYHLARQARRESSNSSSLTSAANNANIDNASFRGVEKQ